MIQQIVNSVRTALAKKSYAFFENGNFNLNLIGIRSASTVPGAFDDLMLLLYKVGGLWRIHCWPSTTDPGTHYLEHPINVKGTAILCPGQYRGAYRIGKHRGYPALVQCGPVRVWRDANRDETLDWGEDLGTPGYYGINIHRAKPKGVTDSASYHSAGCQVFAVEPEHDALMDLARRAAATYSNLFSYTLLVTGDL